MFPYYTARHNQAVGMFNIITRKPQQLYRQYTMFKHILMSEDKFNQISKRDVCDRSAQPCPNGDCGYRCPTGSSPSTALPNVLILAELKENDDEYARCGCDIRARGHKLMNEIFVYDTEKQQFCLKFATGCSFHLSALCHTSVAKDLFCLLEEAPHLPLTAISGGLQSTSVIPAADRTDKPV